MLTLTIVAPPWKDLANPQCLDRDHFLSNDTSHSLGDEDDEDQDDDPGDQDEDPSPPQVPDHQGAPEVGPSGTAGLNAKVSKKWKATSEIIEVFSGLPKKCDLLTSSLGRRVGQWPKRCSGPLMSG